MADRLLAKGRNADKPPLTGEHLKPKGGFQLGDSLARARLSNAHGVGGPRDIAGIGYGYQQAPVQKVHHDYQ